MSGAVPPGLVEAVQTNCHIADARHAADLTLCIYLLQMREFHRWERGLPFGAALARDAVGAWIAEREALWSALEDRPFVPAARAARPAGAPGPLRRRRDQRLSCARWACSTAPAWSGGAPGLLPGRTARPRHARGPAGPQRRARTGARPDGAAGGAGSRRRRRRRSCCGASRWRAGAGRSSRPGRCAGPTGSAFEAAVQAYGLDHDFEAALPRWLDEQGEVLVLHELGEVRAGRWLDPAWAAMRLALPTRRADLYARAVRDHLADFGVTLPTLLDRRRRGVDPRLVRQLRRRARAALSVPAAAPTRSGGGRRRPRAAAGHRQRQRPLRPPGAAGAGRCHARDGEGGGAAVERLLTAERGGVPRLRLPCGRSRRPSGLSAEPAGSASSRRGSRRPRSRWRGRRGTAPSACAVTAGLSLSAVPWHCVHSGSVGSARM